MTTKANDDIYKALGAMRELDPNPINTRAIAAGANDPFNPSTPGVGAGGNDWQFPLMEDNFNAEPADPLTGLPLNERPYSARQRFANKVRSKFGSEGGKRYARGRHETMSNAHELYLRLKEWIGRKNIKPKKITPEDLKAFLEQWELKDSAIDMALANAGMKAKQIVTKQQIDDLLVNVAARFDEYAKDEGQKPPQPEKPDDGDIKHDILRMFGSMRSKGEQMKLLKMIKDYLGDDSHSQ